MSQLKEETIGGASVIAVKDEEQLQAFVQQALTEDTSVTNTDGNSGTQSSNAATDTAKHK